MIGIKTGRSETTIDLEEMREGLKHTSRLMTFPDGRTRLMTLPDVLWVKADLLQTELGWPEHALAEMVWDTHHTNPEEYRHSDLEEGLRYCLRLQLKIAFRPDSSNDRYFEHSVDEDLPQSER